MPPRRWHFCLLYILQISIDLFQQIRILEFKEIYKEYSDLVYNLALQYVQNKEDAEEITQDVFLKVYDNLNTYRGEALLKTWIYRITINRCLDFIKSRKATKRRFWLSGFAMTPEDQEHRMPVFNHPGISMESKEAVRLIFEAINQLPDKQKTALILLKIENLTQKETAQIMTMNEKALESLFFRAKNALAKQLQANEGK
ncbi:MAG: RNA polymerase sigma factor [Chitinophagaceae bacterium]|nr:RNA polymerase sigma factor [Chitinophagaceae bacterium]